VVAQARNRGADGDGRRWHEWVPGRPFGLFRCPSQKKEIPVRTVTRWFVAAVAFVLVLPVVSAAQTSSDMEILRQKLQADKKLVVATAMQLTEAEAKGFWPVYDAFQADLGKINTQLGQVIKAYAAAYRADTLTNEKAQELIGDVLKIEQAEVDLKKAYAPKLGAVVSQIKVARYLQIESKIRALIKYELAGEIPLAK
jgi:hypothetical protein